MFDLYAAMQGFLLAPGLFICPGPKDVLVFREALLGRSRAILIAISSGSNLVLIAVGVLGVSTLLETPPASSVPAGHGSCIADRSRGARRTCCHLTP